ncbi:MAG: sugar phosphate isomerase/epimerase [Oscillospiraceae bacterium]|nr:sugar phosphate isomerase/epimerase [Oscillospiraceae bacterium]
MEKYQIFAFADEASSNLDEQIDAMRRNALQGLELRSVDEINVSDLTNEQAKSIRHRLDDAGLKTWSIGSPIGKIDIDGDFEAHLEKYRRTLELANILGAENIRLFSFFIPNGKNPDDSESLVIDRLSKFAELAQGTGVTLCHENEKDIYGDIAVRCEKIHRALPSVKAIFDPANFVQCGQDTLAAWEILKPYVKYLHIKDALHNGNVVPAGKGDGNVAAILRAYAAAGGTAMTLEPHLAVFSALGQIERHDRSHGVGAEYVYENNHVAFDAAATALKELLEPIGK